MNRTALVALILVILLHTISIKIFSNNLFPEGKEMPGGEKHWLISIEPTNKNEECEILSATYAYFANESQKLFDITRKNIYSVNARVHVCKNIATASKLYDKFYEVGDKDKKQDINFGEKGFIYIIPANENDLSGNFYLNSLNGFTVLQIHSDDGFVLMDIADIMLPKIKAYLENKGSNKSDITMFASKDGYNNATFQIKIKDKNVDRVDIKGYIYDTKSVPVANATIVISETGNSYHTDRNGYFHITIGDPKAQVKTIFYTGEMTRIEHNNILQSGYYIVDMYYIKNDKSAKDHWKLTVNPDGKINGISLNPTTETILTLTGVINNKKVTIERICTVPIKGGCIQKFEGYLEGDFIKGKWTGVGGGGLWRLYIKSFELANEIQSTEEAGIKIELLNSTQNDKDVKEDILLTGANDILAITPLDNKEDNFYNINTLLTIELNNVTTASNINMTNNVKSTEQESAEEPNKNINNTTVLSKDVTSLVNRNNALYFYSDPELKKMVLNSIPFTQSQDITIDTDISRIYLYNKQQPYYISFKNNITGELKASIKVNYVKPITSSTNYIDGIFKVTRVMYNSEDVAGNTKNIAPNENDDILLELLFEGYKNQIEEVRVRAVGKRKVEWNTRFGNIYPGIAIITKDGTILNDDKGEINYITDKYTETIYLSFDQGSLLADDIEKFTVTLKLSSGYSEYEYHIETE